MRPYIMFDYNPEGINPDEEGPHHIFTYNEIKDGETSMDTTKFK